MVSNISEKTINCNPGAGFQNFDENDMEAKLIAFWDRHPKAKLSLNTGTTSREFPKNCLRSAIGSLVNKGILAVENTRGGLVTYGLTERFTAKDK
jgi:hypothetical protein